LEQATMSRESLKQQFLNCGANYAEVLGPLLITAWPRPADAEQAAAMMQRAGLCNVRSYLNGDETATVVEGTS
jgi:hypothetical protein